jgi:hypothetical protein
MHFTLEFPEHMWPAQVAVKTTKSVKLQALRAWDKVRAFTLMGLFSRFCAQHPGTKQTGAVHPA